jgi:hypothetical protein
MENITAPSKGEDPKALFDDPVEMAKRTRYMFWVPDASFQLGGYFKTVKTQDEVPIGSPSQECIVMG